MNFTDLSIFSEFPDLIVQEAFTENETVRKVNKGIDENHLFKLLAIDASAPINLKWVVQSIRESYRNGKFEDPLPIFLFYQGHRQDLE